MSFEADLGYSKLISQDSPIWRQLVAEFIGTLFVVFIGCGSTLSGQKEDVSTTIRIALAFGFAVTAAVEAFGRISSHINPAVTVAMFALRRIQLLPALSYIAVQLLAATAAVISLKVLTPDTLNSTFGLITIGSHISVEQAFGIEFFVTFLLVLTIFTVGDQERRITTVPSATIGAAVFAGHLFAIPYTGCGLNPARVFASAAVMSDWTNHWVYWVAECCGALSAAIFYLFILAAHQYDTYNRFYMTWMMQPRYRLFEYSESIRSPYLFV